jgi:hypothetical protein
MKYMLLIYSDEKAWTDSEREHCYAESTELTHELHARGQYLGANPLQPVVTATSVRVRDGKRLVTDGPFAETREQLGGFFLVETKDLNEAVTICSLSCHLRIALFILTPVGPIRKRGRPTHFLEEPMNVKRLFAPALVVAVGLATVVGSLAIADSSSSDAQSAGQPEMQLPPGWTAEDMQACMLAATPGEMHKYLASDVGVWHGNTTMWMAPDTEPMTSECTFTVTPMMDGRYTKCEISGEMPGMGPYDGFGITGFDNVAQQFVSTWVDNHSTGIMFGTGKLSSDGKSMSWNFTVNCPITKKPTVLREVDTVTGPNTKTLELFGSDPKTGKEFKMMSIELTKE